MLKLLCATNTFVKKERINGVKFAFAVNEKKEYITYQSSTNNTMCSTYCLFMWLYTFRQKVREHTLHTQRFGM